MSQNLKDGLRFVENQIVECDRALAQYRKAMEGVQQRKVGLQAFRDDLKKALETGTVQGVIVIPK